MFTNKTASYYSQDKVLIEAACLSTDTKPTTGVANGSKCIEMDTGKKYMFNEEDSEWEELPSSGGGGGGGTTVEALSVTQNGTYTAPSGKAYSPVTVNVSGGSSDFSTAQMTIINTVEDSLVYLTGVRVDTQTDELFPDDELGYGTTTVIVVLYKGNARGSIGAEEITSTTGGIVLDENAEYVISGDCTVTVKGCPWE